MREVHNKKNHDYAGDKDPLANFREFGWYGIIVRISDKYHRIINFTKKGVLKVVEESFKDTLLDLANYCLLAIILWEEEQQKKKISFNRMGRY